jgi:hypothetical protein
MCLEFYNITHMFHVVELKWNKDTKFSLSYKNQSYRLTHMMGKKYYNSKN